MFYIIMNVIHNYYYECFYMLLIYGFKITGLIGSLWPIHIITPLPSATLADPSLIILILESAALLKIISYLLAIDVNNIHYTV